MNRLAYRGALAAAFAFAVLAGFTTLAEQLDNDVYDFVFRAHVNNELGEPTAVIYGIDEATLRAGGGTPKLRAILAEGLETLAAAQPKAVIIDLILADANRPRHRRPPRRRAPSCSSYPRTKRRAPPSGGNSKKSPEPRPRTGVPKRNSAQRARPRARF